MENDKKKRNDVRFKQPYSKFDDKNASFKPHLIITNNKGFQ
jgi:hypothetical protein